MMIRQARHGDLHKVLVVEKAAFGSDEEVNLVKALMADASAKPVLSLLAFNDNRAVGHILFTKAHLVPSATLTISILAPLAVVPGYQKQGVGGQLIEKGVQLLSRRGTDLIFVLGHPQYYPRHGFQPAGKLGLDAPFPIPDKNADAWMVKPLRPGILGTVTGKILCADQMNRPEYWRE